MAAVDLVDCETKSSISVKSAVKKGVEIVDLKSACGFEVRGAFCKLRQRKA